MKTIKLILILLAATCFTSQAQIMNPGFEDLNSNASIQYWGIMHLFSVTIDSSGNSVGDSIVIDQSFCKSSSDAHSGLRAVEMRNAYNYTTNTAIPGGAFLSADTMFSTYAGFVSITSRPQVLGFYYKYFPVNNDTASAWVDVMDINGNTIGYGEVSISATTSNYTYINTPIVYTSNDTAAMITVHFNASKRGQQAQFGTRFLVDDVSIDAPNGIETIEKSNSLSVYPNPTQNFFNVKADIAIETVSVFNMLGQEVYYTNYKSASIDVSSLSNGMYSVQVKTAKGMQTNKLIIQR